MQNLAIAFVFALTTSVLLFLCVSPFVAKEEVATSLAIIPFVSVCHICELLERRNARRGLASQTSRNPSAGIRSLDGFGIRWIAMFAYGVMTLVGIMFLSVVGALLVMGILGSSGARFTDTQASLLVLACPITLVGGYFLGRWIGARCARHGLLVLLFVVVLGVAIGRLIDLAAMSEDDFEAWYQSAPSIQTLLLFWGGGVALYGISGLLGYWRGRRTRLVKYLRYLLTALPEETRETLVVLAHDEAQAVVQRRLQHQTVEA